MSRLTLEQIPLTLFDVKMQLRLEGIESEDAILESYILLAHEYCETYCEMEFSLDNTPQRVLQAMRLIVAHYFENRVNTTDKPQREICLGANHLLDSVRTNFRV